MSAERRKYIPESLAGKTPLVAASERAQQDAVVSYARAGSEVGIAVYPRPDTNPVLLQHIAHPESTFYFHGTLAQTESPVTIERGLLRRLQTTAENVSAFVVTDEDGKLAEKHAAVEFAYLIASGKLVVRSQSITEIAESVPQALRAFIETYQDYYPVIPAEALSDETLAAAAGRFSPPEVSASEKKMIMHEVVHLLRELRQHYPDTPQKYEVHTPSTYLGKVEGAIEGARAYQRRHSPHRPTIAMQVDARKFPSGEGHLRPEQPIAVNDLQEIDKAVDVRIAQVDAALAREGDIFPKPDTIRLTVAHESGLFLGLMKGEGVHIHDLTVGKIKNLDSGAVTEGVSDLVEVKLIDFLNTLFSDGGIWHTTIGRQVYKRLLLEKGIAVDPQDWYQQYDTPNNQHEETRNQSRTFYIAQSSTRAAGNS